MTRKSRKILTIVFLCLFALFLISSFSHVWHPRLAAEALLTEPLGAQTVGKNRTDIIAPGKTLHHIARHSRIGYNSLIAANPDVAPWLPKQWQKILLPYQTIIPAEAERGITINLAEYNQPPEGRVGLRREFQEYG